MEVLIHTADGTLRSKEPVLTPSCKSCTADSNHDPVPCMSSRMDSKGLPCQCTHCIRAWWKQARG